MYRSSALLMGLVLGLVAASSHAQHHFDGPVVNDRRADHTARVLATAPLYPANRADDSRRPGFNGRLWIGETFDNGYREPLAWGGPGPTHYGASDRHAPLAFVRIGTQVIAVSPWVSLDEESFPAHERGRHAWLRERGYTGGVRTHVNPAVLRSMMQPAPISTSALPALAPATHAEEAQPVEPRATIRLRQPRQPTTLREREVRFSWPAAAPVEAVSRTAPRIEVASADMR